MSENSGEVKTPDTQMILHQARAAFLRNLPKGAETFLSAGCAGRWFFDWIEWTYGKTKTHIGVEFYCPKPDDLQDNVTWIANTCSDMSDVDSKSCDIVFSGQNYEHLWPNELIGFMLEAARITREGGLLVIDSPNREITEALNWTHPEHTVEGTPDEVVEAMHYAGFDVTAKKGIWLCRDGEAGRTLTFGASEQFGWSVTERLVAAVERPQDSFIWWVEARRSGRDPDRQKLADLLNGVFQKAWPQRLRRTQSEIGSKCDKDGNPWFQAPAGTTGALMYGPYAPLRPGRYVCTFEVDVANTKNGQSALVCEALSFSRTTKLAQQEVSTNGRRLVKLDFTIDDLLFGVEFRCITNGSADVSCRAYVDLVEYIA
ncbi:class I SAM-dependent methyltransferase [Methylobacterium thuringiense]|uniref:Methyltransferase type 11 domain-containing protein n=1 Tax=Methylobacterium thuringiense TaxID=1003091 RepID=A0ABQ4TTP4_9HYPH|nr:methyltransferase domain-containing protein [Methylobacterium thuringiense]GJE57323.1 hypothetical protein EKPJFOCH_3837 [Methylobacterium thuringiense]